MTKEVKDTTRFGSHEFDRSRLMRPQHYALNRHISNLVANPGVMTWPDVSEQNHFKVYNSKSRVDSLVQEPDVAQGRLRFFR